MTFCYADASAILRNVLSQPGRVELAQVADVVIASSLAGVECRRVLDRIRLVELATETELLRRIERLREIEVRINILEITRAILLRASEPMQSPLGTLDAIHLASALQWRDDNETEPLFATHDRVLARAARTYGLTIVGAVPE